MEGATLVGKVAVLRLDNLTDVKLALPERAPPVGIWELGCTQHALRRPIRWRQLSESSDGAVIPRHREHLRFSVSRLQSQGLSTVHHTRTFGEWDDNTQSRTGVGSHTTLGELV